MSSWSRVQNGGGEVEGGTRISIGLLANRNRRRAFPSLFSFLVSHFSWLDTNNVRGRGQQLMPSEIQRADDKGLSSPCSPYLKSIGRIARQFWYIHLICAHLISPEVWWAVAT